MSLLSVFDDQLLQDFMNGFYSVNPAYISWWKSIAGVELEEKLIDRERMYIGKNERTVFAIVRHPVARGVKNEYFHQVGKIISSTGGFGDVSNEPTNEAYTSP